MKVNVKPDVLDALKEALKNRNRSAVRIDLGGFGWGGPTFDVVLDEQKENDEVFDIDGVKFVADNEFSFMIEGLDIVKMGSGFYIADQGGCS